MGDERPHVLMTRPASGAFRQWAIRLGVHLEARPYTAIQFQAPGHAHLLRCQSWDGWIFTSARGVEGLLQWQARVFQEAAPAHLFVVGPQTANALPVLPSSCKLHTAEGSAMALLPIIRACLPSLSSVAFIGAAEPRPELPEALRSAHYRLSHFSVYRTRKLPGTATSKHHYQAVLFGSPKAVEAFFGGQHPTADHWVAIGPTTASALRQQNCVPTVPPAATPSWEEMVKFVAKELLYNA